MKKALEQFVKTQGWSLYGIVDYQTLKQALKKHEGIFEQRLAKGLQADMHWLETMKADRYHPENKLSDIRSVIVLGAWYADPQCHSEAKPKNLSHDLVTSNLVTGEVLRRACPETPRRVQNDIKALGMTKGKVALYAHGKDYHKVLKKKLLELSDWLKQQNPKVDTYVAVDSGPTVDRVLAKAAGLGFFGKNSMIINPSRGSYFFIASVMTNIDLEATPKKQMPSCGNCTRCIDKCPTGAITAPGVIDANLCISYLTIENKGGIPLELRSKIGNRIFGCDICQEVCPFNIARAHKQEILIEGLKGKYGVGESLELREVLSIKTDEEFLKRFAGTPLMRAKRRGLLRNACVVAGNSGDPSLIPDLQAVLDCEEDPMLREHAEWALGQLKHL